MGEFVGIIVVIALFSVYTYFAFRFSAWIFKRGVQKELEKAEQVSEEEKEDGICYRLGDLYQWSLKGTTIRDNVLQEVYQPLFYGSIQEYANQCGEEYQELGDK